MRKRTVLCIKDIHKLRQICTISEKVLNVDPCIHTVGLCRTLKRLSSPINEEIKNYCKNIHFFIQRCSRVPTPQKDLWFLVGTILPEN